MSQRKHAASVSHHEVAIAELRADRSFAVEYLKSALEERDDPERRAVGLLALRDLAEAHGGLAAVAQEAGITPAGSLKMAAGRSNQGLSHEPVE